ncbi:hypothetical protein [Halorussus caseinilyticus]|uniref:Uncharacterized protein n=1 Tax=Halorussus caseinilyticus TaxID=3034025 RepID=A0ABD5WUZ3_9EURY|nr:hypothetical protein [Halorussus sp. DT72]
MSDRRRGAVGDHPDSVGVALSDPASDARLTIRGRSRLSLRED